MTHEDKKLRRQFAARPCEICPYLGVVCLGPVECFHVIHAGMGGGRRLDVRLNLLSCCAFQHRRHHDGNLEFNGQRLREEEFFELVALREHLPNEVDVQQVLRLILRLPKDASAAQISRSVALLPLADRRVAWETLREMGKVT